MVRRAGFPPLLWILAMGKTARSLVAGYGRQETDGLGVVPVEPPARSCGLWRDVLEVEAYKVDLEVDSTASR
ncbi:hypothetical protein ASF89_07280 [Frigoribacterium sp. Leaf172]|nr:hypothetical protein ASF89_07280 [Frigoribacterium sp. Leaf172]